MIKNYDTTRFGEIQVDGADVITLPNGPLGFPNRHLFTFVDEDRCAPFRMLQSLEHSHMAFVVVNPLVSYPDYLFQITPEDLKILNTITTKNLSIYVIVKLNKDLHKMTINLQGPLVLNTENNLMHQLILVDSKYNTKELLLTKETRCV